MKKENYFNSEKFLVDVAKSYLVYGHSFNEFEQHNRDIESDALARIWQKAKNALCR